MHLPAAKRLQTLGLAAAMLALTACGGSKPAAPTPKAAALAYTDPAGSGWRLVKNPASTATHLVLDLMAPAGGSGLGVGLALSLDTGMASWAKVSAQDADYVHNLAYDLGADAGTRLSKAVLKGAELQLGVFQKGLAHPLTYSGALLSVAIDFNAAAQDTGTAIPVSISRAQHLTGTGELVELTGLALGTLTAK